MITKIKTHNTDYPVLAEVRSIFEQLYPISYYEVYEEIGLNSVELELMDIDYNDIERDLELIKLAVEIIYPNINIHIILNQLSTDWGRVKSVLVVGDRK